MFLLSKLSDILYYEIIRKKQDVKAEFFSSKSYINILLSFESRPQ